MIFRDDSAVMQKQIQVMLSDKFEPGGMAAIAEAQKQDEFDHLSEKAEEDNESLHTKQEA